MDTIYSLNELQEKKYAELWKLGKSLGVKGGRIKAEKLIELILELQDEQQLQKPESCVESKSASTTHIPASSTMPFNHGSSNRKDKTECIVADSSTDDSILDVDEMLAGGDLKLSAGKVEPRTDERNESGDNQESNATSAKEQHLDSGKQKMMQLLKPPKRGVAGKRRKSEAPPQPLLESPNMKKRKTRRSAVLENKKMATISRSHHNVCNQGPVEAPVECGHSMLLPCLTELQEEVQGKADIYAVEPVSVGPSEPDASDIKTQESSSESISNLPSKPTSSTTLVDEVNLKRTRSRKLVQNSTTTTKILSSTPGKSNVAPRATRSSLSSSLQTVNDASPRANTPESKGTKSYNLKSGATLDAIVGTSEVTGRLSSDDGSHKTTETKLLMKKVVTTPKRSRSSRLSFSKVSTVPDLSTKNSCSAGSSDAELEVNESSCSGSSSTTFHSSKTTLSTSDSFAIKSDPEVHGASGTSEVTESDAVDSTTEETGATKAPSNAALRASRFESTQARRLSEARRLSSPRVARVEPTFAKPVFAIGRTLAKGPENAPQHNDGNKSSAIPRFMAYAQKVTKMPNFKRIHEKAFSSMQTIDDFVAKKKKLGDSVSKRVQAPAPFVPSVTAVSQVKLNFSEKPQGPNSPVVQFGGSDESVPGAPGPEAPAAAAAVKAEAGTANTAAGTAEAVVGTAEAAVGTAEAAVGTTKAATGPAMAAAGAAEGARPSTAVKSYSSRRLTSLKENLKPATTPRASVLPTWGAGPGRRSSAVPVTPASLLKADNKLSSVKRNKSATVTKKYGTKDRQTDNVHRPVSVSKSAPWERSQKPDIKTSGRKLSVNRTVSADSTKDDVKKQAVGASKLPRFQFTGGAPASQSIKLLASKNPPVMSRADRRAKDQEFIKGVRTNKRFRLQMERRGIDI
ncbi:uncharacterized protein LOC108678759 [Hyalella azteca]|uniref:Uncharacterized protein LOC108678759 n=1 Tax=Hyalella azteca TaxID=294128 RepID=A0A8B7P9R2_HYAAZ|nr:uncharacterized protein LOC108678759 [Hyalella azteca]